jgi:hypothetical protein
MTCLVTLTRLNLNLVPNAEPVEAGVRCLKCEYG